MLSQEAVNQTIALGAQICARLRDIYFNTIPWNECYKVVAVKFGTLKANSKDFYVGRSEIDILIELNRYTEKDLVEMIEK